MSYALTESQVSQFKKNGFIGPFKLFEENDASAFWETALRPQLLRRDTSVYPTSKLNYDRHLDVKEMQEIVCSPKVVDRLRSLLGDDLICWRTEWFPKYPGDSGTEWHQAKQFFEFEGQPKLRPSEETERDLDYWVLTVWIAMTDATIENGCMKLLPGSHLENWYFDESKQNEFSENSSDSGFFGYSWEGLKVDKNWTPDESKAVKMEVKAGEFFIFTSKCLHGSYPNTSDSTNRFAMSARYVVPGVYIYEGMAEYQALGETLPLDRYLPLLVSGSEEKCVSRVTRPFLISPKG